MRQYGNCLHIFLLQSKSTGTHGQTAKQLSELMELFTMVQNGIYQYSDLCRLHVQHLGDTALHDQEMRIVDIQLNGTEEILYSRVGRIAAVDQVLVASANDNLTMEQTTRTEL